MPEPGRPSIKASEVLEMADRYANHLVGELTDINKKYPHAAGLTDPEQKQLASAPKTPSGYPTGPTPESVRLTLKSLFCASIAEQFTIAPPPQ